MRDLALATGAALTGIAIGAAATRHVNTWWRAVDKTVTATASLASVYAASRRAAEQERAR